MHLGGPGYNGSKSTHKWYKAGQDNSFGSVFFVKFLSRYQVVFFEEKRILTGENFGANFMTKPIADVVAQDRGGESDK